MHLRPVALGQPDDAAGRDHSAASRWAGTGQFGEALADRIESRLHALRPGAPLHAAEYLRLGEEPPVDRQGVQHGVEPLIGRRCPLCLVALALRPEMEMARARLMP